MRPARADITVGLAMIVKDEAPRLPRLAASLDGQLDHWTIVDTGSSDDTVEVARAAFAGVPGEVIQDEWRGYGPSRNVALTEARRHSDFVLTLDADDTLHGAIDRAIPETCDGVEAEYRVDALSWWMPRLIRATAAWEWRGRAHEFLTTGDGHFELDRTVSFYVLHHGDGGNRATKYERELGLLLQDQGEVPGDPRTIFYLARTYDDGGEAAHAAGWYRVRIGLVGWDEETWYARWRLGCCLLATGRADEGAGVLWRAWAERPWRAEPLWSLAEHYRRMGLWRLCFEACALARRHCDLDGAAPGTAVEGDRLFVHLDVYQWRIAYEESISAYYVGARDVGLLRCNELLARTDLPEDIAASVRENLRFYLDG